jgi:DNA polymerase-1
MWNVELPPAEWFDRQSKDIGTLVTAVRAQKEIAIDTETTGLVTWKDLPLFWSLSFENRRICMPADTLPLFRESFSDASKKWVMANAKYDTHILANYGIHLAGELVDTQVMHALLYEEQPHGLKDMAKHILGWRWSDFMDVFKADVITDDEGVTRQQNIAERLMKVYHEDRDALIEYASNDAFGTMEIFRALNQELQAVTVHSLYEDEYQTLKDIFWKTEVPFTKVLWKCERNGVLIDDGFLKSVATPVRASIKELEQAIGKLVGRPINPNSPTQLRAIFFGEMGLRPITHSKGGKSGIKNPQVDVNFLEHYKDEVPLAKLLLSHRELAKLLSTYVEGLPEHYDRHGRIHTRFNQDVARTGRLSSASPNLQNIPNPEADKFKVRKAFVAPKGHKLICCDYEALEMRLLAAASEEKDMVDIFLKGWDIHMGNASLVFDIPYEDIKKAKKKAKEELTEYDHKCLRARAQAKNIGFG